MIAKTKEQGIALISALAFLVIIVALVSVGLVVGVSNSRQTADNTKIVQAQHAAEAGIERAIYELWYIPQKYATEVGYGSKNFSTYNYKRILDGDTDLNGSPDQAIISSAYDKDGKPILGPGVNFSATLNNGATYQATVRRRDTGNSVVFEVLSTGTMDDAISHVAQTLELSPSSSWDFALLTDNVACVFCHVEVYDIKSAYLPNNHLRNFFRDPLNALEGAKRVRVGSISDMNASHANEADTYISGTIYTRGLSNLHSNNATVFGAKLRENAPALEGGDNFADSFKSFKDLKNEGGNNYQDCNNGAASCSAYGNEYVRYPEDTKPQPDGLLPTTFPLPVADANLNRIIDDFEWNDALEEGTVTIEKTSSITALVESHSVGGIVKVPDGSNLDPKGNAQLVKFFSSATSYGADGKTNLVLRGVKDNPLEFTGKVYVDGDVIISGRVKGNGMLVVRGNVYIVGDIVYDCDGDCDYSDVASLPTFGIAAGGSILAGNYFRSTFHNDYKTSAQQYNTNTLFYDPNSKVKGSGSNQETRFRMQDYGIDLGYGYNWNEAVGGNIPNPASFSMTQIAFFNQSEFLRAKNDASYIPRFYIFRQGEQDWIWRCSEGDGSGCWHYDLDFANMRGMVAPRQLDGTELFLTGIAEAKRYGTKTQQAATNEGAAQQSALSRAVYTTLSPKNHWTLGVYHNNDVAFNSQFGDVAGCSEAEVEDYIANELFSTEVVAGMQKQGVTLATLQASDEACYNRAVARERLRAMNAELTLHEMWRTYNEIGKGNVRKDMIRESDDGPCLRFDGLLYTGNAMMLMSATNSATQGCMIVNGSLIAADMGVLVPGWNPTGREMRGKTMQQNNRDARGLRIQYDDRTVAYIADVATTFVLKRSSHNLLSNGEAAALYSAANGGN